MNFKFTPVLISPEDERALSNAVDPKKHPQAYKWLCYVRTQMWNHWKHMPNGDHLKEAYRNDVWAWNDEDLAQ